MSIALFYIITIFLLITMGLGVITLGVAIHFFILATSQYVTKFKGEKRLK